MTDRRLLAARLAFAVCALAASGITEGYQGNSGMSDLRSIALVRNDMIPGLADLATLLVVKR